MTVQPLPVAIASGRLRPLKPRAWVVAACADVLQRQGKAPTRAAITAALHESSSSPSGGGIPTCATIRRVASV